MKTLLRIVGVLVVIVVAFLLFGFLLPQRIVVERTTTIDLPPSQVYPLVVDLKRWPDWQAWNKEMDPTVTYQFSDPSVGEGAHYEWTGEKLSTGTVAITGVVPDRTVDYTVDFANTGANPGTMELAATEGGEKTTATWSFDMDMGFSPINRYCGLLISGMMDADFDTGLANLKKLAETEKPKPLPAAGTEVSEEPSADAAASTPIEKPATPTEEPATTEEPSAAPTTPESAEEPAAPSVPEGETEANPSEPSAPDATPAKEPSASS